MEKSDSSLGYGPCSEPREHELLDVGASQGGVQCSGEFKEVRMLVIKELVDVKFSIQQAVWVICNYLFLIQDHNDLDPLVKVVHLLLAIMSPFMTMLGHSPLGQCTSRGGSGQQNMPIALGVCLASCPR